MLHSRPMKSSDILSLDRLHLWHPYSSFDSDNPLFAVNSARGCTIKLADGRELIDGMSSWWSAIHGYNRPELNQAAQQQLEQMSHIMFGGFTHAPAARLAQTLATITPQGLNKVFLADSGSVSVEVAMKMALQYWIAKNQNKRNRFLTFRHGYHGDTFKPMSVCDPITGMHHLFKHAMEQQIFAQSPSCDFHNFYPKDLGDFKNKLSQNESSIAAIILEPVVQGAGGMRFYHPQVLREIRKLCNAHNILLIADEIATGFGRSGKLFACEHADIAPDIMCIGKALTGGYMSLAATLCTEQVAATVCSGEAGVFMHGPTFMGNPLACSVANASIELLLSEDYRWESKVKNIEHWLEAGLSEARNLNSVRDVRVLGAIGVIEMKETVDLKILQPKFVEAGIWLRPFGKLVYMMPPFVISKNQCENLCRLTITILNEVNK